MLNRENMNPVYLNMMHTHTLAALRLGLEVTGVKIRPDASSHLHYTAETALPEQYRICMRLKTRFCCFCLKTFYCVSRVCV